MKSSALTAILCLLITGCASMNGSHAHTSVCSYDTTWEATVDVLKGYSITTQNKEKGVIETAWIEMEGKERSFGIFGREGFGNRERAQLTATVTHDKDVASVNVTEIRQRWHARGGVTSQATKWWPIEPSEEVLQDISTRLTTKLREKGCATT
ncbi:MAG: hypothetical protein U0361_17900 [Nitrospiraceae bacterium]